MAPDAQIGIYGPYERLLIEVVKLADKVISGQPEEVRERLWTLHLERMERLHSFFEKFKRD